MKPILITSTTSTLEEARNIASILVKEKLAACVNIIGPIRSIYTWKGDIEDEEEYKLFIKSFESNWPALSAAIKKHHSYDVPEITMVTIENLNPDYLDWMRQVCVEEII